MGKRSIYIAPLATVSYFPVEEEDPLSAGGGPGGIELPDDDWGGGGGVELPDDNW